MTRVATTDAQSTKTHTTIQVAGSVEPQTHELLTRQEAASIARVSRTTVSRWIEQGLLAGVKVGGVVRVPRVALLRLLGLMDEDE